MDRYAELHKAENNAGPGDHRRTALQVVEDQDIIGKWSDKVALITGCSSGIGIETARALAATGAKVYATVRDLEKGKEALEDILEPGRVELLQLKLDSLASVRACAAAFQAKESKLNILINNAGIMALPERNLTEDGFEAQFGTNHLGHFLLFKLLEPQLLAGSTREFNSRVVALTSVGHRYSPVLLDNLNFEKPDSYDPWIGYGHSKTAVIQFANELERRYGNAEAKDSGKVIHAFSVNPGAIRSGLQAHVKQQFDPLWDTPVWQKVTKNPGQGAATTVWAAVEKAFEGTGGFYLEDVQVSGPAKENPLLEDPGYVPFAFDPVSEKKLWEASAKLVGVSAE